MKTECSLSTPRLALFGPSVCLSITLSVGRPCVPLCSLSEQTEMRVEEWEAHPAQEKGG